MPSILQNAHQVGTMCQMCQPEKGTLARTGYGPLRPDALHFLERGYILLSIK